MTWEQAIVGVPMVENAELEWGPSEQDIIHARNELVAGNGVEYSDDNIYDVEFEAEADDLLTEHLDSLRIVQNYRDLNSLDSLQL